MGKEKTKLNLKPVTPLAIQVFKKNGLLDFKKSTSEKAELSYDLYANPQRVKEIAMAIFEGDFTKTNWEQFDLSLLAKGIQDFLFQLAGHSQK